MRLPRGLLKRLIREGYSAPEAMKEAWRQVRSRNPGARWHGREATRAEADRVRAEQRGSVIGAHFYRGKREAHRESQTASRRMGLNPKKKPKIFGVFIESKLNEEIHAAARWLAAKGLTGKYGDPLPEGLSRRAFDRIQADLGGFQELVRGYKRSLKRNPGATWHKEQEQLAEDLERRETRPRRRTYLQGMADAHTLSAHESRKMGLNPRLDSIRYVTSRQVIEIKDVTGKVWKLSPKKALDKLSPALLDKALTYPNTWVQWAGKNPRGARTVVGKVFRAKRWAKRWARGRPVRRVKGGWAVQSGRKRTPAQERTHRRAKPNPDIGMTFNTKRKALRYANAMRKLGHSVSLVPQAYGAWRVVIHETQKNPIAVYNPPKGRLIYGRAFKLEAGERPDGIKPGPGFNGWRHRFNAGSKVAVYGLPDGSVLLKSSTGKRLWADR